MNSMSCALLLLSTKVLPIEDLLRECWDPVRFTKSVDSISTDGTKRAGDKVKTFTPEESSRVTLKLISDLMASDYAWACIALIAHLSQECEGVGLWCEGCPCPEHQVSAPSKVPGQRRAVTVLPPGAANCPFKTCRAPELARGVAILRQEGCMNVNRALFNEYIAKAPHSYRSELHNTWTKSTSKIWGILDSGLWEVEEIGVGVAVGANNTGLTKLGS